MRHKERKALREAIEKLDSFLGASRDEETSCSVFRPGHTMAEPFSEEQKRAVRIYLDSWVREPLVAAIKSLEGERGWENESALRSYDQPRAPFKALD